MELLFQQLLNGLTIGSVYSLVALGLTLVFGILHVPNFAHGAFYMIGAYFTLTFMTHAGMNYWVAMFVSVVLVAIIGVLCERLIFHKLGTLNPMRVMVAAIGVLLFFESFAHLAFGTEYQRMASPYDNIVTVFGLTVTVQRILIIIAAVVLMVALHLFLTRTMIGASIIAMAQNREGAFLVGINSNQVAMLTFAIAGGLAAAAASLASPINLVFPTMGNLVIMKAFVIIIIGGMGSIPGAIVGGFLLGLSESLGATYISNDYKDLIAFILLVIILTAKPTGLFSRGVH
ncbi:branched-chain amino acid ABC transporter permease [Bacillus luteolus]|uniref:Branched-chain amino acid ABC transporter permease n=1 Tax=Litchfieldia luteola TaxID=682179 RepID=A0ABR9QKC4_9BACI|nr:branched-chain amino acid ABC transporter permease [Cytobacillus luteolus]MBE4908958.1 branched-chain amino acid ABC transporter permease [Cytobacillus luteolus]MBP1941817.1 branched-chain amino acid transport system permease protein [Cytobacillus luteolus]